MNSLLECISKLKIILNQNFENDFKIFDRLEASLSDLFHSVNETCESRLKQVQLKFSILMGKVLVSQFDIENHKKLQIEVINLTNKLNDTSSVSEFLNKLNLADEQLSLNLEENGTFLFIKSIA